MFNLTVICFKYAFHCVNKTSVLKYLYDISKVVCSIFCVIVVHKSVQA